MKQKTKEKIAKKLAWTKLILMLIIIVIAIALLIYVGSIGAKIFNSQEFHDSLNAGTITTFIRKT